MNSDSVKLVATYVVALVVIIGGFVFLFLTRSEELSRDLQLVIAGFMGSSLTFVFTRETQTQTARQVERSIRV